MKAFSRPPSNGGEEWKTVRERIDLARVATGLLGPAPGRPGERGAKLWWRCPYHDDANPSFCIVPGQAWFRCYGCGQSGDCATLVMKVRGCNFPQAVAYLTGDVVPPVASSRPATAPRPPSRVEPGPPAGMSIEAATALVDESINRLWGPDGSEALAYLTGPDRCLTPETIRAARLGYADRVEARSKDGHPYIVWGIVVPWLAGGVPALVKVRQPHGRRPKYAEVFRDRARLSGLYPGPEAIRPGRPLVVVEGEFDTLCLGQELVDLASVVTLGSASARPDAAILNRTVSARPRFVATDADAAGLKSAEKWSAGWRRVLPPGCHKDWTEAKAGGVNLARWWGDVLSGVPGPELFTWEELAAQRWGPAVGDPTPGIIVDRFDRDRTIAALEAIKDQETDE